MRHARRTRATVLKQPKDHVYGKVGEYSFRVSGRAGPAAIIPFEDELKNEYDVVPMSRAVKAIEDLIADGYDRAWFKEILDRAEKYTCWKPSPSPAKGRNPKLRGESSASSTRARGRRRRASTNTTSRWTFSPTPTTSSS